MDASPVKQTEARIHMPCFLLTVDVFQHLQLEIQQLLALCLELFDCHIQNLFFVECSKMMLALLNCEC